MLDPVTLYKDGKSRRIAAIDAPGWLRSGWSVVDESKESAPHSPLSPEDAPPSPSPTPHSPLSPEDAPPSPSPTPLSPALDQAENSSPFLEEVEITPKRRGSKNGANTVSEN